MVFLAPFAICRHPGFFFILIGTRGTRGTLPIVGRGQLYRQLYFPLQIEYSLVKLIYLNSYIIQNMNVYIKPWSTFHLDLPLVKCF